MKNPTAPLPRTLLDTLADAGFKLEQIAASAGIHPPEKIAAGLDAGEADRFLEQVWRTVDDPSMGLKAGSALRPERFGISGLTAMMASDLRGALALKSRYNRLVWGDDYELSESDGVLSITARPLQETRPYTAAKIDMEFASLITFGRYLTRSAIAPLSLGLKQARPAYAGEYERLLGVVPRFGQAADVLRLRSADADLPLVSANLPALEALRAAADAQLSAMTDTSIKQRVWRVLLQSLAAGAPSLAGVAKVLHLSERTLQRKLSDEGLSFTRLLDEVRRSQAMQGLRANTHAAELAYLLGFEDVNSFYRAFRRWTGTSPDAWRAAESGK